MPPSSFHGKINEIPGIAVDDFVGNSLKSRAFFLSHCHTDHTNGLYEPNLLEALKANDVFVYMSEVSAAIVKDECKSKSFHTYKVLGERIKILEMRTINIKLPATNGLKEEYISVTAIPAGHCLGAIMILFGTCDNQNILYTGDFRITQNDVSKLAKLHKENNKPISIDSMYVDTTFIERQYLHFPKRGECLDAIMRHIEDWISASDANYVALSKPAKFGYEFLYVEIWKRLKMKTFVDEQKLELYRSLRSLKSAITNDDTETRVHECRISSGNNHVKCGLREDKSRKYFYIWFSARRWKDYDPGTSVIDKVSDTRIQVCFPTHCSRSEVIHFVEYFAPKKVFGFPNEYKNNNSFRVTDNVVLEVQNPRRTPQKRKAQTPRKEVKVDRKVPSSVLKRMFDI